MVVVLLDSSALVKTFHNTDVHENPLICNVGDYNEEVQGDSATVVPKPCRRPRADTICEPVNRVA